MHFRCEQATDNEPHSSPYSAHAQHKWGVDSECTLKKKIVQTLFFTQTHRERVWWGEGNHVQHTWSVAGEVMMAVTAVCTVIRGWSLPADFPLQPTRLHLAASPRRSALLFPENRLRVQHRAKAHWVCKLLKGRSMWHEIRRKATFELLVYFQRHFVWGLCVWTSYFGFAEAVANLSTQGER